jgi:hypothetical protein
MLLKPFFGTFNRFRTVALIFVGLLLPLMGALSADLSPRRKSSTSRSGNVRIITGAQPAHSVSSAKPTASVKVEAESPSISQESKYDDRSLAGASSISLAPSGAPSSVERRYSQEEIRQRRAEQHHAKTAFWTAAATTIGGIGTCHMGVGALIAVGGAVTMLSSGHDYESARRDVMRMELHNEQVDRHSRSKEQ